VLSGGTGLSCARANRKTDAEKKAEKTNKGFMIERLWKGLCNYCSKVYFVWEVRV
jgi:hypothetical protein